MENKRKFPRVDAKLPFKESLIDAKSITDFSPRAAESALLEFPSPPSHLYPDALTADWIKYLDAKINAIANLLMTAVKTEEALLSRNINISAGGAGFDTDKQFEKGEVLEMHIAFDGHRRYCFYGEIMWIRHISENRYRVGTNFLNMSRDFIDEINRFVFSKQREILSRKRYNLS